MFENKHTPGPWRIVEGFMGQIEIESDNERDNADPTQVFVLARDIGGRIHGEQFDDYNEREANVSLIAAAPDLLEALQGMMKCFDDGVAQEWNAPELDAARAAIAKATQPLNPA